jgi:hypothetical protein
MIQPPILLLLTNSIDYVSDMIISRLGTDQVFRYNTDLWQDYKLRITSTAVTIENPAGRRIEDAQIVKVFRRSNARASTLFPDRPMTQDERFAEEEIWEAWNDLMTIFWNQGKVVLSQPLATLRLGKLHQLRVAEKYFPIPSYRYLVGSPESFDPDHTSVAKSFSFKFDNGVGFYSRMVKDHDLDPRYPWFLTEFVDAERDVTVAVIRDELFAFSLDRSGFIHETIDWRLAPSEYAHRNWQSIRLPDDLSKNIFAFLAEMGVHYARLDFLQAKDRFIFLESNFTGEWGWLDPDGKHGLLTKILREIDPRTPVYPCPRLLSSDR